MNIEFEQLCGQDAGHEAPSGESGRARGQHTQATVEPRFNVTLLKVAEPTIKKETRVKRVSKIIRVLAISVVGLMIIGTAQAQTQDSKITTDVVVEETTEVCIFKISGKDNMTGMMCSGCTGRVETALLKVDGIISVDAVDYGTGTATVTIAKESQAKELIPAAIEKVNFVATLIEDGEEVEKAVDD